MPNKYLELFYGTNNIFDKDSSFLNDLISVSLFNGFAIDKNIKINKDTLENYCYFMKSLLFYQINLLFIEYL